MKDGPTRAGRTDEMKVLHHLAGNVARHRRPAGKDVPDGGNQLIGRAGFHKITKGIYLEPIGCDTSHGSVVEFKGQWYAFYHNSSLSGQNNLRSICVDKLFFNADGTIQPVIPTREGVPAVSGAHQSKNHSTTYGVTQGIVGQGATLENDPSATTDHCVQNLHLEGAYLELRNIDGAGGRATIGIHYAAEKSGKLRLIVNGADYSLVNTSATGGWSDFTGYSGLTVPLGPGKTNVVRLLGGHSGVNVDCLKVAPFDTMP